VKQISSLSVYYIYIYIFKYIPGKPRNAWIEDNYRYWYSTQIDDNFNFKNEEHRISVIQDAIDRKF